MPWPMGSSTGSAMIFRMPSSFAFSIFFTRLPSSSQLSGMTTTVTSADAARGPISFRLLLLRLNTRSTPVSIARLRRAGSSVSILMGKVVTFLATRIVRSTSSGVALRDAPRSIMSAPWLVKAIIFFSRAVVSIPVASTISASTFIRLPPPSFTSFIHIKGSQEASSCSTFSMANFFLTSASSSQAGILVENSIFPTKSRTYPRS